MKLTKHLLNVILLFSSLIIYGQQTTIEKNFPFSNGELLTYDVRYNFGPIWIDVGTLELTTDTIVHNSLKSFNFTSESKTKENWKWLYEVSSSYDVISSQTTLKPAQYNQSTKYGGHQRTYNYSFKKDSIHLAIAKDEEIISKTIRNDSLIFDGLSAIYYARTIEFNKLNSGDSIEINILHGDELLNQKIVFEGIVDLKNDEDEVFECFKFSSLIKNNSIISDKQPAQVWVTTDKERLPLKISAEIIVGSVNIYLSN